MDAQHTPGPWTLDEDDLSITADVGAHICNVTDIGELPCVDAGDEDRVQAECLANARLISAAPDLLEQARLFQRTIAFYIRRDENTGDDEAANMKRGTLASVQAAIAKAEGRS